MQVLFCDNHLLVVVKPANLVTQATEPGSDSLETLAKEFVKQKYAKKGNVFLEPIHRLDKPVMGLVLFARTSKALLRLHEMMRQRAIAKTYLARVEGIPKEQQATLEHYLVHEEHFARVVASTHPHAKQALLSYRTLSTTEDTALLEVQLLTGRYHQIRVQLAAIGCPILGDRRYGSKKVFEEGIALIAAKLALIHPVTKEPLSFSLNLSE